MEIDVGFTRTVSTRPLTPESSAGRSTATIPAPDQVCQIERLKIKLQYNGYISACWELGVFYKDYNGLFSSYISSVQNARECMRLCQYSLR